MGEISYGRTWTYDQIREKCGITWEISTGTVGEIMGEISYGRTLGYIMRGGLNGTRLGKAMGDFGYGRNVGITLEEISTGKVGRSWEKSAMGDMWA